MLNKFRYWTRDFFTLNKSEQRGIFVLLLIILLLLFANLLLPGIFVHKKDDFSRYDRQVTRFLQAQKALSDSLHLKYLQKRGRLSLSQAEKLLHPVYFDPNHLSEKQGLQMGLTMRQIKTIHHYLAKGGCFRKKEDLKKIRGLSATEYVILAPYIRIHSTCSVAKKKNKKTRQQLRQKVEINSVDTTVLQQKLLLPSWLAARIVKYRHLLGGFYSCAQLREVYGMKPAVYHAIRNFVEVDTTHIRKINLNTAVFKQLLHHPYINYETTKKLIRAREELHGFSSIRQAKELSGLADSTWNKIRHYLYLRRLKINLSRDE